MYRYATDRRDHGDLAGGKVLRSAPGMPGFPVRLADEVFQRAAALHGADRPPVVWDPCCGSGHLLTALGLLHPDRIAAVLAGDVDEAALSLARRNLALLTADGLRERRDELAGLHRAHGKDSHREAVAAADRLAARVRGIGSAVRRADVFDPAELRPAVAEHRPDLVITDVPYGELTRWRGAPAEPVAALVRSVAAVLAEDAVIAVSCRARRVPLGGLPAVGSLKVGHRAVAFLRAGQVRRQT